jgi:hypothetical protein
MRPQSPPKSPMRTSLRIIISNSIFLNPGTLFAIQTMTHNFHRLQWKGEAFLLEKAAVREMEVTATNGAFWTQALDRHRPSEIRLKWGTAPYVSEWVNQGHFGWPGRWAARCLSQQSGIFTISAWCRDSGRVFLKKQIAWQAFIALWDSDDFGPAPSEPSFSHFLSSALNSQESHFSAIAPSQLGLVGGRGRHSYSLSIGGMLPSGKADDEPPVFHPGCLVTNGCCFSPRKQTAFDSDNWGSQDVRPLRCKANRTALNNLHRNAGLSDLHSRKGPRAIVKVVASSCEWNASTEDSPREKQGSMPQPGSSHEQKRRRILDSQRGN